jgi:hypothetical protein
MLLPLLALALCAATGGPLHAACVHASGGRRRYMQQ